MTSHCLPDPAGTFPTAFNWKWDNLWQAMTAYWLLALDMQRLSFVCVRVWEKLWTWLWKWPKICRLWGVHSHRLQCPNFRLSLQMTDEPRKTGMKEKNVYLLSTFKLWNHLVMKQISIFIKIKSLLLWVLLLALTHTHTHTHTKEKKWRDTCYKL